MVLVLAYPVVPVGYEPEPEFEHLAGLIGQPVGLFGPV